MSLATVKPLKIPFVYTAAVVYYIQEVNLPTGWAMQNGDDFGNAALAAVSMLQTAIQWLLMRKTRLQNSSDVLKSFVYP